MCGITAIYNSNGEPVDREFLEKMTSILSHRGPDGSGINIFNNIGLGHRRLSIIDLGGGAQPMSNEDETLWITFNGEIYNYIELRNELIKSGHKFKTESDTEVIIHAYEEWGENFVKRFNGIFAFVLLDLKNQELVVARDHLGVKPLYYTNIGSRYLFASEIKSLLQDKACAREVDVQSLSHLFTFRFVPSPNTMFRDIKKLPPGHMLKLGPAGLIIKGFWDWTPKIDYSLREEELIEEYQSLLEDAVRLQLRSDVPVGLFLSSGIDSGVLLAIMSQLTRHPVQTFTIGFEDGSETNETDDARKLAKMFGANHREMIVSAEDYINYYQNYIWDIEEPVGNETAAAFYFVSKIASESVKVTLCGQGADEPWAGYHRYIGVKLSGIYSRLPRVITHGIKSFIDLLPRNQRLKRGSVSLFEKDILTRFLKIYSFFSDEMKENLYQEWVKEEFNSSLTKPRDILKTLQTKVIDQDPLSQMLYIDTRCWLPDDLLMVSDKTSMANSIESRVPLLDYRLIEFIEKLPPKFRLRGFEGKYLHKKAVQKWLPKSMVYQKKKGFDNPIHKWLRGKMSNFVNDLLLSDKSGVSMYFNKNYIESLIKLHNQNKEQYLRHIYLLISFEMWYQKFIIGSEISKS
jgi:asparagine synthase (glutamine-hydrolysing)